MKRKLLAILGILGVVVGVVAGLSACSGSSGSSAPPSATTVLSSNGYTYDSAITSTVQGEVGSPAGFSSLAVGEKGSDVQLVMVFTSPTQASAGAQAEQTQLGDGSEGIQVVSNGDVVTATGTLSAFAAQGG